MAQLVVRNLDDDVKAKLRVRAAEHGHSMEEEVRAILCRAVEDRQPPAQGLGTRIAARFARSGLGRDESIAELRGEEVQPAQLD